MPADPSIDIVLLDATALVMLVALLQGVPDEDVTGAYILNVVVLEALRGQGVGRSVMRAAMYRAVHAHGAKGLYTSVEADNDVAVRLYRSCGFEDFSSDSRFESGLKLGQYPCMSIVTLVF